MSAHAATHGFVQHLGAEIVESGPDRVVLHLDVDERHLQPAGVLHGGVHCTLVETAASLGGHLWLAGQGTVVGVNNNTNFLRAFRAGRLVATATPIHRGRTQQLWLVEITDDAGKLIGRGEVRLHNLPTAG
ncbi:MAG TPA: PaaI family thioesterase [Sporichthya sp.]|nr:PaaI family thioesterase [Sporichthya sp.]